jgi:hypothetical protein
MKQKHNIYFTWKLFRYFKFKSFVTVTDKGYIDYELFKFRKLKIAIYYSYLKIIIETVDRIIS